MHCKTRTLNALVIGLLVLSQPVAGKKPPLPEPDPAWGAVGISLGVVFKGGELWPFEVYFARLGGNEDLGNSVIPATVIENDQAHLLNVEPGRYAAVAARFRTTQTGTTIMISGGGSLSSAVSLPKKVEFLVLFSADTVARTQVHVAPGRMASMGQHDLKLRVFRNLSEEADDLQVHYSELIPEPQGKYKFSLIPASVSDHPFGGKAIESLQTDASAVTFWLRAREIVFKKAPGWRELAEVERILAHERVRSARESSDPD